MDPQGQQPGERCDSLSRRVQRLCLYLVLSEALYVVWVVVRPVAAKSEQVSLLAPLALLVILWLIIQRMNHQLVSCGTQDLRYRLSPRRINRPEFSIRMVYHLIINWSVIPLILLTALAIRPSDESRYLAYASLAATVFVWVSFNLLHRRINRARNLVSTTVIAAALIAGSLILVA